MRALYSLSGSELMLVVELPPPLPPLSRATGPAYSLEQARNTRPVLISISIRVYILIPFLRTMRPEPSSGQHN